MSNTLGRRYVRTARYDGRGRFCSLPGMGAASNAGKGSRTRRSAMPEVSGDAVIVGIGETRVGKLPE